MADHDPILAAIDKVIEDKTFNLEAVESIKAMRDKLARYVVDSEKNLAEIKKLGELNTSLERANQEHMQLRTDSLSMAETNHKKGQELAILAARLDERDKTLDCVLGVVNSVFRNTEVRRTMHGQVPQTADIYNTVAVSEDVTEKKE